MDSSFYRDLRIDIGGSGTASVLSGSVASTAACGGPWAEQLQHGGPPSALLVAAAEQLAASAAGRDDLLAVRLAAEFIRPVPVTELTIAARVERLSARAVLISAALLTPTEPARTALQARVWLLAPGEPPPDRTVATPPVQPGYPDPAELPAFGFDSFPYARHLDWRQVHGSADTPGPAACWISARIPLVAGQQYSPLQRAALFADSASGISAELDWDDWSFANVDLDLHLSRTTAGEWLLIDAVTDLGDGVATARSRISDCRGPVGAGLQTLLVRRSAR